MRGVQRLVREEKRVSSASFLEQCWKLIGLPPPAAAGQVWHVEYAKWPEGSSDDVHRWYLLLELLEDQTQYQGSYWRVFDLLKGEVYGCHMDFHHGTKQLPRYTLVGGVDA